MKNLDVTIERTIGRQQSADEPLLTSSLSPPQNRFSASKHKNRSISQDSSIPNGDLRKSIDAAQDAIRDQLQSATLNNRHAWRVKNVQDLTVMDAQMALLSNTSGQTLQEADEDSETSPHISALHGSFLASNDNNPPGLGQDESFIEKNSCLKQPTLELTF